MTVLADLEEFVGEHRPHGELTWFGWAAQPTLDGYRVGLACPCGAGFSRWVTSEMAEYDLLKSGLLHLDAADMKALSRLSRAETKATSIRVTAAGLVRRLIKNYLRKATTKGGTQ